MIAPKCECGHSRAKHSYDGHGPCVHRDAKFLQCGCRGGYRPKRPIRAVRKSAVPRRSRKVLPRCKHCAHPHSKHYVPTATDASVDCMRCESCPGYEPARGIRQKRRTPGAAIRRIADDLWTRIVHMRQGCEIQHYHLHKCAGGSQAMHGIPRTFSATRWLPINGFRGCAGAHKYFTERPEAWSALLLEAWGLETFRELWARARASQPVDMEATVASLRAEARSRGIE